jgi:hypothetical protein
VTVNIRLGRNLSRPGPFSVSGNALYLGYRQSARSAIPPLAAAEKRNDRMGEHFARDFKL